MSISGAISVEVVQRADAAGSPVFWANRWEVGSGFNGVAASLPGIANAFAQFHRANLAENFFVDYVRLSSYAPDSRPYNPDNLYVLPVGQRGTARVGSDRAQVLPLTNVLHVRKITTSGRLGHLFLRGALVEGDIQSDPNSGAVILDDIPSLQLGLDDAYGDLRDALQASSGSVSMISGSGLILQERPVLGLRVAGITSRSLRTRRKSRLVANAGADLARQIIDGVTLDELPEIVNNVRRIAGSIGIALPLLP